VVPPQRSGMASGVNTTFRQIGIAVGIAAYGSIFTSALHSSLTRSLASVPSLAGRGAEVAAAVKQGTVSQLIATTPPGARGPLVLAVETAFTSAMNDLFIVSGILALVGSLCAVSLIRGKDFIAFQPQAPGAAGTSHESPVAVPSH
jgi:hypothetical protein